MENNSMTNTTFPLQASMTPKVMTTGILVLGVIATGVILAGGKFKIKFKGTEVTVESNSLLDKIKAKNEA